MLQYRDIMTSEIVYFEKRHEEVFARFCTSRNIHYLPAIHDSEIGFKYSKGTKTFDRFTIRSGMCVEASDNIFRSIAINRFKNHRVLFVKEYGELVGVVHYCDYNRPPVFEEIYKKLYKLERGLLYLITEFSEKTVADLESFLEIASISQNQKSLTKQDFRNRNVNLLEIMRFASEEEILDIRNIDNINRLRNKIAHSNDLIEKEPRKKSDLKYKFQSFKNLIEGNMALDTALKQVANRAYIMKADHDQDYSLKASRVFDEVFA